MKICCDNSIDIISMFNDIDAKISVLVKIISFYNNKKINFKTSIFNTRCVNCVDTINNWYKKDLLY